MKTVEEMKARFAQQIQDHNRIRDEVVAKMSKAWVEVLESMIGAAFESDVIRDTVSVSANRFDSPPPGQCREEIELLASDIVVAHFMNLGFNATRLFSGSTPHQRVEVTWGE